MPTDTKLKELIINELTEEQYNALTPNENELYLTPDNSTPDTKTISLFGNHSILVPKDSTDTNIDLYNHAIIFNFDYGDNDDMYNVYLNVVSSRNLVVDSLTDLKTLLGNTFTRSCSAASDNLNDHVVAVRETGFIISDLTSISFASAKNLKITDTVTTI